MLQPVCVHQVLHQCSNLATFSNHNKRSSWRLFLAGFSLHVFFPHSRSSRSSRSSRLQVSQTGMCASKCVRVCKSGYAVNPENAQCRHQLFVPRPTLSSEFWAIDPVDRWPVQASVTSLNFAMSMWAHAHASCPVNSGLEILRGLGPRSNWCSSVEGEGSGGRSLTSHVHMLGMGV